MTTFCLSYLIIGLVLPLQVTTTVFKTNESRS